MVSDNTHSSNITSGTNGGTFDKLASTWMTRVKAANEHYYKWAQKNKCEKLEKYYCGDQWEPNGTNYEPYVINKVFSTIEIKLPTLLFDSPVFHIKPKPKGMAYDIENAIKKALLREDLLNTIVADTDIAVAEEVELAILDAFFRFGIIEVGYSANWVVNPNADKPILRSDNEPYVDSRGNVLKQPKELPETERIFVKRISAKRFRVGGLEGSRLDNCNWCGYWEFVRVEDFKANKNLKNLEYLNWAGTRSSDFVPEEYGPEIDSLVRTGDLLKIWKIWDIRKKKYYVFTEGQALTHLEEDFERLPLFDLRFHKLTEGWYPLPPVRNWKPAQDELNDSHEQMRNHRKRFTRKFLYNAAQFDLEEEKDKLMNGGDGTFCAVQGDSRTAVSAVPNADLGAQEGQSLVVTNNDFNDISGVNSEARSGAPDTTTATQANIINQHAQIRDSRSRIQVAKWLCKVGREVLLLAEEKLTLPVWVKMATVQGGLGESFQDIPFIWHQITTGDLSGDGDDGFDFDVDISLDSMSPVENDAEKGKFLTFLAALTQYPELSESPILVRELAYRLGYRNEKVIAQLQQVASLKLKIQLAQLGIPAPAQGAGNAVQPGQMAQAKVAQQTSNNVEQIRQQIQNQVTGGIQ